ncbi:hypothetical protein V6N13_036884 [Hibiscus sabdariffa]
MSSIDSSIASLRMSFDTRFTSLESRIGGIETSIAVKVSDDIGVASCGCSGTALDDEAEGFILLDDERAQEGFPSFLLC